MKIKRNKIKQKIKEFKEYLISLNTKLKKYPKGLRFIISIGLIIASILCAPFFWIPIPIGLLFFLLGGKIALDLIKDIKKERIYKGVKRGKTMININEKEVKCAR